MAEQERWILARSAPAVVQQMSQYYDPLLAHVLVSRKLDTPDKAQAFLHPIAELADPFLYKGMRQAVDRILQAIADQETIVIYGDFDTDGVTSTCVMVTALEQLGARVSSHIPNRFDEGYGLNTDSLKSLQEQGADLIVTVDCGVRAVAEAAYAHEIGLDMIITDHHSVPDILPQAVAVVDAKQSDCTYPFKEHAGVGVAYSTARALYAAWNVSHPQDAPLDASELLDLAAVGTVADMVPLGGENRIMVQQGLKRIAERPRPGIAALIQVSGSKPTDIDASTIAFRLAPRLNAMGRLEHADTSFDLLRAKTPEEASELANQLDETNRQRQDMLSEQVNTAEKLVDPLTDQLFFAFDENFHEGIVGLVASRLMNHYYRPALVMRRGESETTGSARSVEGFHITQALEYCADLLVRFGGHAQAAGFTLENGNIEVFRQRLLAYADEHLTEEMLQPRILVDAIVDLPELNERSVAALTELEPCGTGNLPPVFASRGVRVEFARCVGADGRHLQMQLSQNNGARLKAIAFGLGELEGRPNQGDLIDIVYTPRINHWNGNTSVDLEIQTWRPTQ